MNYSSKTELERLYGTPYIDRKPEGYYPVQNAPTKTSSMQFISDSALFYFKERLSIDAAIKEITFALIALVTYLFMQHSGRINSLKEFGYLIGVILISAMAYNFYKASFKSLAPGLFCLLGGLFLLSSKIHQQFFGFLSNTSIEYIIGTGAFFIALSLFKTENN